MGNVGAGRHTGGHVTRLDRDMKEVLAVPEIRRAFSDQHDRIPSEFL